MAEDTRSGAEKQSASPDSAVFLSDPEEDCFHDDKPPVFYPAAPGGDAANPHKTGCRCHTPDPATMFACGGGLNARRLSLLKSLSQDSEYSLDSGGGALFGGGAEAYLEELGFAGSAYPTIPDRFMPSLIERMADAQLGGLNERILLSIGRFRRSLGKRRLFRQLSTGRPCPAAPPRRLCPDDAGRPLVRSNTGPSRYSDEKLPSEEARRNSGISRSSLDDLEGQRVVCEAPVVAIRISDADGETVTTAADREAVAGQPDIPVSAERPPTPRESNGSRSRDFEWTDDREFANSGTGRGSDGRCADVQSQSFMSSSAFDSESESSKESQIRSAPHGPFVAVRRTDCRNALEQDSAVTTMTGKEARVQDAHFDVKDVTKEHSAEVQPLHRTEKSGSVYVEHIDVSDSGSDRNSVLASRSNVSKSSSCVPVPTRRIPLAKNALADANFFLSWNSADRGRGVDSEAISKDKDFPFDEESSVSRVPGALPPAQPLPHCREAPVPSRTMSVAQNPLTGSPADLSTPSPESTRFTALLEDEKGKFANTSQPGLTDKTHVDSNTLKYIRPDNNNLSELKSPEIVKLLNGPLHSGKNEYTSSDSLTSFMSSMLYDNRPSAVHIPQPNESSFHTDIAKDNFGDARHRGLSDTTEPARDEVLYDTAYRLEVADVLRVQSDRLAGKGSHAALRVDGRTSETERQDDEVRASGDTRSKEDPKHANRRKRPRLRRMSTSLEQPDNPCDENERQNSRSGTSSKDSQTPADPVPLQGYADNHLQTVDVRSATPMPRRAIPEEVFHHCFRALSWDFRTSPSSSVQQDIPSDHETDSFTFLSGTAGERHESPRSRNVSSVGLPIATFSNDEKRDTKKLHDINEINCDSCHSSYVHLVPKLPDQANHHLDTSSVLHPPSSSEGKERVAFQSSTPTSSNSRSVGQRSSTETSVSSSYDFFSFRKKFSVTKDFDGMNRKSPLLRRARPVQSQTARALATEKRPDAEEQPVPRFGTFDAIQDDFSRTELLASNRCLSNEQLDVKSAHSRDLTNHSYTFPQRIFREGHDRPSILSPSRTVVASKLPSKQTDKSTGDEKKNGNEMQGEESCWQPMQVPALGHRSPSQERVKDLLRQKLTRQEGAGGPPRLLERSDSASAEFVRSHRNPESRTETSNSTSERTETSNSTAEKTATSKKYFPNVFESRKAFIAEINTSDDREHAGSTGYSSVRGEQTAGPALEEIEPSDSPNSGSQDIEMSRIPSPCRSDLSRNLEPPSLDFGAVPENIAGTRAKLAAEPSAPENAIQGRSGDAARRPKARKVWSPDGKREQLLERKMRIFAKLLSHLVFLIPGGDRGEGDRAASEGGAGRRRASEALLRLLVLGAPKQGLAAGGGAVVEPRAFGSGVRLAVNAEGSREESVFVSSVCMEVVPADSGRAAAATATGQRRRKDRREDRRASPVLPEEEEEELRGFQSASRELEDLRAAIRKAKESRISASQELQELLRRSAGDHPSSSSPRSSPDEKDGDRSTSEGTPNSRALSDLRSKSKRDVLEDTRLFQQEVKKVKQETEEAWSARLERMESRLQLQEQQLARLREENRRLSDRPPSPPPPSDPPSPTQGRRSACCGRLSEQLSRAERRVDELGLLLDQKLIELNKLQIALSAQTKEMIELEKSYVHLQCRLRRGAGKPSALGRLCARTCAPSSHSPRPGV